MKGVPESLGYATAYIGRRNEVLLKSVIALYNMRGRATWEQRPFEHADLIVVGDDVDGRDPERELLAMLRTDQMILSLTREVRMVSRRVLYVDLPLRAGGVAACIEQAEASLLRTRKDAAGQDERRVRLIRWPHADLLAEHEAYLRLATMLARRTMTIAELADRSMKPASVCGQFVAGVIASGCAEYLANDAHEGVPGAATDQKRKGLLERIRMRLGLIGSAVHP